ncbi:hypothetical protein DM02DRAFT_678153 [Periconia macrospinosa]|uniref:Uncharacterized protein n=1 Tax=Periconia macrospinosa TaxID=97972 RepID=A0A2V1D104_9PLEO|nr:hypothetical protein DM02DRAFT_678153 [Periconia macrospinosa]
MARSLRNSEVVDLTGDSDNSATSQKSSSNRTTISTRRSRVPVNMGIRQSIIDLTVGDDDDSPITISDQRSESSEPSPTDSTTNSPAITNEPPTSSPLYPDTSAALGTASNVVSYPIRQSSRNPASLTSILSDTSPSSTSLKEPRDIIDRPIESGYGPIEWQSVRDPNSKSESQR